MQIKKIKKTAYSKWQCMVLTFNHQPLFLWFSEYELLHPEDEESKLQEPHILNFSCSHGSMIANQHLLGLIANQHLSLLG